MTALTTARRALGAALIALVIIPFYRLLERPVAGFAGQGTAGHAATSAAVLWSGAAVVALAALLAALLLPTRSLERRLARAGQWLARPPTAALALGLGSIAAVITAAFGLLVLDGKPNLIDAMSQLVQARYLAAGTLAGPTSPLAPFWHIQNTVLTENGWVSHYPPGHVVLLALGFRVGAVWAVGPVLMGTTAAFACLTADRLFPDDRATARLGAALVTLNPFLIGLAGAYMNHIAAAAFTTAATYFTLRARDGRWTWTIATGAAAGMAFATRPLSALAIVAAVTIATWIGPALRNTARWTIARLAGLAAGAAPFALALGAYNAHFFGSPLRFGYDVALGPAVRPGFHQDPWGNAYGPLQALGYTSSDLTALSLYLLETPLPVVPLIGLFLLAAPRLRAGDRILAAWALTPVGANALYWHHGLFMGPRMLNEAAPAWAIFAATSAVALARHAPPELALRGRRIAPRPGVLAGLLLAGLAGLAYLGPQRLLAYAHFMRSTRTPVPRTDGPALVFVHGGWTGRVAMRLAGHGMRLDSLETALRQNETCDLQALADALDAGEAGRARAIRARLDLRPRPFGFPPSVEISPGNYARLDPRRPLPPRCLREIHADRFGILDLAPFLWQGDLPGLPGRGAMFVRDLGPERNAALLARYPDRRALMLYTPAPEAAPVLEPYETAIQRIWGDLVHGELVSPPASGGEATAPPAPRAVSRPASRAAAGSASPYRRAQPATSGRR